MNDRCLPSYDQEVHVDRMIHELGSIMMALRELEIKNSDIFITGPRIAALRDTSADLADFVHDLGILLDVYSAQEEERFYYETGIAR